VIVTHTDHDFVDVTVKGTAGKPAEQAGVTAAAKAGVKSLAKKAARKAAFGLAASAAVLGALSAGHGGQQATQPVAAVSTTARASAQDVHLQTTFHHPFYDETRSAFVEAKDLQPGDVLQTPTGTTEVTGVRLYHENTSTYDLKIGSLHTYYVEAGNTLGDIPVETNFEGFTHAEHNALKMIDKLGGVPIAGGASRSVCSETCAPFIRATGGKISGAVYQLERGMKVRTFYWPGSRL
jgi:hypothetical protein